MSTVFTRHTAKRFGTTLTLRWIIRCCVTCEHAVELLYKYYLNVMFCRFRLHRNLVQLQSCFIVQWTDVNFEIRNRTYNAYYISMLLCYIR